jgi:hypothetical protein
MSAASGLRTWARGSNPVAAGVELLIRAFNGRFARDGQPWITHHPNGTVALDVDALGDHLGVLSGGERRVLRVVIALIDDATPRTIDLADIVAGVDRDNLDLILAALAHAGGSHEHTVFVNDPTTGRVQLSRPGTLHPWSDEPPQQDLAQQDLAVSRRYLPAPTAPREVQGL